MPHFPLQVIEAGEFVLPFEELPLAALDNAGGILLELDIFAHGEATIAFDRLGDWNVRKLVIDACRSTEWRTNRKMVRETIELPATHPLHAIIAQALVDCHFSKIQDAIDGRLAGEQNAA